MPTIALFGINIAFAFTAWAVVTALYIWPHCVRARASRRCARCWS